MAKSNQAVQLLQTRSTLGAFLEALNGRPGDLDAWLECNNEAEVRAHVLALVKDEREKCTRKGCGSWALNEHPEGHTQQKEK